MNCAPESFTLMRLRQLAFCAIRLYNRGVSQPFKLFRLQQVDSQLDKVQTRLAEINIVLNDNSALQQARGEVDRTQKIRDEANKELKRAEQEVKSQEIKLEQNQSKLYGGRITNPKELEDLQNEAQALKRYLATLEDRQLEAMISLEDAEREFQTKQTELKTINAQLAEQSTVLIAEQDELLKEVEQLEDERAAVVSSIPPNDLALYAKLREMRAGLAVAKVSDQTCTACGTQLSQALAQAVRSPTQINRCDNCSRILYAG